MRVAGHTHAWLVRSRLFGVDMVLPVKVKEVQTHTSDARLPISRLQRDRLRDVMLIADNYSRP